MGHKVKAGTFADSRRGSRHERGYGSAWDKIRALVLKRDAGLCQPCQRAGHVTPDCNTVDHIIGKAAGGTDEPGNLQTICKPCHVAKTQAEALAARAGGPATPSRAAAWPQAGGGEKSRAAAPGTERLAKFSCAQVSRGGCTAPAGETPAKRVGRFKLRVLP